MTSEARHSSVLATVRNKAINLADCIRRMQREDRNESDDFVRAQEGFFAAVQAARDEGASESAIRRAVAQAGNRPDRARALEAFARG